MKQRPNVAVLMTAFKPDPKYLLAQMTSIRSQVKVEARLYCVVSDLVSGSLIKSVAEQAEIDLLLIHPERPLKVTAAISIGLQRLAAIGGFEYLAFCDQDDVWLPEKLTQQVEFLRASGAALTYSDAIVIDEGNQRELGRLHKLERRPPLPSLLNLALGNIGTGMTFLMTRDFAATLQPLLSDEDPEMLHDYQAMLLGSLLDVVVFDTRAWVRYRQHSSNLIGLSAGSTFFRKVHALQRRSEDTSSQDQADQDFNKATLSSVGDNLDLWKLSSWSMLWRLWLWYYRKIARRLFMVIELEREVWRQGLRKAGTSVYSRPALIFASIFVSLFRGRWVRAVNAVILLWLIARQKVDCSSIKPHDDPSSH